MPVKPPPRWTARSLTVMFLPHMFRNPKSPQESIGPRKEKVPVDADLNHYYIKRKTEKMTKSVCKHYKINTEKPKDTRKGYLWSVVTGEWVPPYDLKLDYFFPFALGPMVGRAVSDRIAFRDRYNGLLLPPMVWAAYNNWKLTITPQKEYLSEKTPQAYQFRILDSGPETLKPVYRDSTLKVGDLDQQPLHFKSPVTPNPHSCYFQSCCAMWKLTYLEQPDRSPEEFWERFQYRMNELWGTLEDRQMILDIFKPQELLTTEEVDGRAVKAGEVIAAVRGEPAFEDVLDEDSIETDSHSQRASF